MSANHPHFKASLCKVGTNDMGQVTISVERYEEQGGDNQMYNLVYSCKSCNSQKRQNTLEEFAIKINRFDWLNKFDTIYASAIS
jgi:hypothetical protein